MTDKVMEMARRFYGQFIVDNTPGATADDVPVFDDSAHGVQIAAAAIREAQRLDADNLEALRQVEHAESIEIARCIARTAIRTGDQYGEAKP